MERNYHEPLVNGHHHHVNIYRTTTDEDDEKDNNHARGNWSNNAEFILSCVGFAVGLGNFWRFPYLCYKNGGGAFLVAYWTLSTVAGFPIILMEQSLGQYTSQGPMHCWRFTPALLGAGMAMIALSFYVCFYYAVVISWAVHYLFASFTTSLPWQECNEAWADYRCEPAMIKNCGVNYTERGANGYCYSTLNSTNTTVPKVLGLWNETLADKSGVGAVLATDQYFHNYVLGDGNGAGLNDDFGLPRWPLIVSLAFIWVIVFLSLAKGIKSSGKVIYFTTLAPYVVLAIFIVRGLSLPGAWNGVKFFITPDFEKIKQAKLWYTAAGQLFFSVGCCYGGMLTLASYNKFKNNIVRDVAIVVVADAVTSMLTSLAIFSVIGYGALTLQKPIDSVVEAGAGLVFVVYPKVITQLPGSTFFSIIFFLMIICVGLSSQFNYCQTVITPMHDLFPNIRSDPVKKLVFLGCFCLLCFSLGLFLVCPGGPTLLEIIDQYSGAWSTLVCGVFECVAISWLYGYKNFTYDLKLMMPWLPLRLTQNLAMVFWGIVTPLFLMFILVFTIIAYKEPDSYAELVAGWMVSCSVLVWIPLGLFWVIKKAPGDNLFSKIINSFKTAPKWGPYLEHHRNAANHLELVHVKTEPFLLKPGNGHGMPSKTTSYKLHSGVSSPAFATTFE